jgi:four helix bundle protein
MTNFVYAVTKHRAFARDFALKNQIRKAAVSVMSNIAEGFERGGRAEFIQFLSIAKSSAGEVQSQLYIALDQEYITPEQLDKGYKGSVACLGQLCWCKTPRRWQLYQPTRPLRPHFAELAGTYHEQNQSPA